jgi:hypothetical protein
MPSTQAEPTTPLAAGLAGAGGGAGIVAIANLLTENGDVKQMVAYLAPPATIVLSMLWNFCTQMLRSYLLERQIGQERQKAAAALRRVLEDPNASIELKDKMRKRVDDLEILEAEIGKKRSENIARRLIEITGE